MADTNSTVLTKTQAQELVVTRLRTRFNCANLAIADQGGEERSFGWLFRITMGETGSMDAKSAKIPGAVIVNKHSMQVVASFIAHEPAQFIRVYEKLLAQNQSRNDHWCLTVSFPFPWPRWRKQSVADLAKDAGFYEIRGEENEP